MTSLVLLTYDVIDDLRLKLQTFTLKLPLLSLGVTVNHALVKVYNRSGAGNQPFCDLIAITKDSINMEKI